MALIDTHKVVKQFVAVGLKENQAEAITHVISNIDDTLATKSDISLLKSDILRLEDKLDINMKWFMAIGVASIILLMKIAFFSNI